MKFKYLLLSLIFSSMILIFSMTPGFSATYYVKNGGNDRAAGTSDGTAWATIARVNDFAESPGFSNGDIIQFKRGSTWTSDETLGHDGSAINWGAVNGLTFQAYGTGANPIFDGNSQQPINISDSNISNLTIKDIAANGLGWGLSNGGASVKISYVNGLVIDGVDVDGHEGTSTYNKHTAIKAGKIEGNVEIKNCIVRNIIPSEGFWGSDANGINVTYIHDGPKTSGTVSIHDNTVHDVESDGIALHGIFTTTNIYNNTIYNFGENAFDAKTAFNYNIYNNDFYRGDYGKGGSGGGMGNIVLHGDDSYPGYGCDNVTIRDNYLHDTPYIAIRLLGVQGYVRNINIYNNRIESINQALTVYNSDYVEFYNNLVAADENLACSTGCDPYTVRIFGSSSSANGKIYNNSIYISNTSITRGIAYERNSGSTGWEIKKNIIQMTKSSSVYPLHVKNASGDLPDVSDNAYYNANHNNRVFWAGTVYDSSEQASWRSAGHTDEIFGDPKFKDAPKGDFTLMNDSPCIFPNKTLGVQLPLNVLGDVDSPILAGPETDIDAPQGLRIMTN